MRGGNAESDPLRSVLVNFKGAVQSPATALWKVSRSEMGIESPCFCRLLL